MERVTGAVKKWSKKEWRKPLDCKADDTESGSQRVYSDEDGRKVEERLRSLGYLE